MNRESAVFLSGAPLPVEDLGGGISRQMLGFNDNIMMVKVIFSTGSEGYLHHHVHSQVTYVESGEFEVTVGDETRTMVAGDSYYMAPNVEHGAVCKKAGVLLDVFSPLREDFLEGGN
ncbi:cupin domain-containing protein [Porticoccaceae bacterium]|nr:cupin domain-containing protein [Porticoccaceae bacterium]